MDSLAAYRDQLFLQNAEFLRIDHHDTIISAVYKVTRSSQPPLILKVCPRAGDYHRELYFLKTLAGTLPIPRIVQVVEPKPGMQGAILMEYLRGRLLQLEDWTDQLAYEIGAKLACLHLNRTPAFGDLTRPETLTPDASIYIGQKFDEELAEATPHLPEDVVRKCQRYLDAHQRKMASVDGPCIVHRDFRPGNMIVLNGRLQGVIDWAAGRSGFAEQDFCSMEHRRWPSEPSHKRSLLAGYASIRPVPDYNPIMPLLQLARALAVIGFTVRSETWNGKNAKLYQYNMSFLENFRFDG